MRRSVLLNRALPRGTARRRLFDAALFHLRPDHWAVAAEAHRREYERWITRCEPALLEPSAEPLALRPLISVVVPCFNTAQRYLEGLVGSVLGQSYDHLELLLVDASSDPGRAAAIAAATRRDERARCIRLEENLGISANTNAGVKEARGDFVAFVDHDDELAPQALYEVVRALCEHPDADVIYTDQDKIDDSGRHRSDPLFKPGWSPALLETLMYIGHLLVVRRSLLEAVGPLRSHTDGAQDYDLALRLSELTERIHHVPKVLYHWRMAKGSTARGIAAKPESGLAGKLALEEHLIRTGVEASVTQFPRQPAYYRVRHTLARRPAVSVVVVTDGQPVPDLSQCLQLPAAVELVTSGPARDAGSPQHVQVPWGSSWGAACRAGRAAVSGDVLVFLQEGARPLGNGWIDELAAVATRRGVGAVAPLVLDARGRVASAGTAIPPGGRPLQAFRGRQPGELTPFGLATWARNWLALPGDCLALRAALFDEVAGTFTGDDTASAEDAGDAGSTAIRWCLRLHELGLRNLCWPYARLGLDASRSSPIAPPGTPAAGGTAAADELADGAASAVRDDPYFNPNLDPAASALRIRSCPARR